MRPSTSRRRLNGSIGRAAVVYFVLVFAAGFVLGTIRVLLVAPRWGELLAVLLESPIMLFVRGWRAGHRFVCSEFVGAAPGLAMGAAAFALLMTAELALSLTWLVSPTAPASVPCARRYSADGRPKARLCGCTPLSAWWTGSAAYVGAGPIWPCLRACAAAAGLWAVKLVGWHLVFSLS